MIVGLRNIPSVERVLSTSALRVLLDANRRDWVVDLVRQVLDEARVSVMQGGTAPLPEEVAEAVVSRAKIHQQDWPCHVINATGVILHTNLGRAPLSREALQAMDAAARGYCNLEMDLEEGRRGSRQAGVAQPLCQLTGADAALILNNNAAAVLLGLTALAQGKEVVVSRGESVEIGGGFRIPDVMRQSGATLVEVGTTNRTYVSDYESAVTENTAALLKVHASNFRITGFIHSPTVQELAELGRGRGMLVLHDLGSGCLLETGGYGLAHEPTPQESIAAGVDAAFFSGDKLLGGPQAGIVVGKAPVIQRLTKHPLARALRPDKLTLAALRATLIHYLRGEPEKVPIWRMIGISAASLKERAQTWKAHIGDLASVECGESTIGGGSLPGEMLPTWIVVLECHDVAGGAEGLAQRLRAARPPVVARIQDDRLLLDPRTVLLEEESDLIEAVKAALRR